MVPGAQWPGKGPREGQETNKLFQEQMMPERRFIMNQLHQPHKLGSYCQALSLLVFLTLGFQHLRKHSASYLPLGLQFRFDADLETAQVPKNIPAGVSRPPQ